MQMNEIAAAVRQHFLQKGTYLPTIFIELDSVDIETLVLPQLQEKRYSTPKRAHMLFDAGFTFGQKLEKMHQNITGLCMAYSAVSQDAHTKGVLVFKMNGVNGLTCTARFYDAHRDGGEITVDSHENPSLSGEGMVSPLLPAFMLGVATSHGSQSAEESRRMLSALVSEYERMIRRAGMQ
jgi:hypothetical protein